MPANERRGLPSVDALLHHAGLDGDVPHSTAVDCVRTVLDAARSAIAAGAPAPAIEELATQVRASIAQAMRPSLVPVINATGVILQTNLGRAPLSERALAAVAAVSSGYSNLEFEVERGRRGSRHDHVRALIRKTTGAEDGLVVNNNAAALFMVFQVFAPGREVIVSRGQAVEIGGGFRIPDVLRQSGASLVEVGTTNRTYVRDYAEAITQETAALLRVHTSNFKIVGFTAEASLPELAALAIERGVRVFDDLGSGCMVDTARYGLAHEPTVQESIAAGVDLAMFSGDKLLGGPQCGIIAGKADLVAALRAHPLARALRVDRMTIAALNATLSAYAEGTAEAELPVLRMLGAAPEALKRRAQEWVTAAGGRASVVASRSMVGGGSLPGEGLPTYCCALRSADTDALAARLRACSPPVIARIDEGLVLLDPRTVAPDLDSIVSDSIRSVMKEA